MIVSHCLDTFRHVKRSLTLLSRCRMLVKSSCGM
ncbi:hypothetical protein LINPERHAP1_LOCUS29975 [Linum perenne]